MPFCSSCGAKVDPSHKFCEKCGKPIGGASTGAAKPSVTPTQKVTWETSKGDMSRKAFNSSKPQAQTPSNNCVHCSKPISGKYTELDNGLKYHQGDCFCCGGCGYEIELGDPIKWSDKTKKIYCRLCAATSNSLNCQHINARDYG